MSTPKLQKFYKSRKWSSFVDGLRNERVTPDGLILCEHCGQPITKAYDCIGHHKTELTDENVDDVAIALNPDNIKLVHFKCHNAIHNRFQGYQGRKPQKVYIVYGAPLAGKSEYVAGIAEANDIVISMDRLWQAIKADKSGTDKPAALKSNVFGMRDALLDMIKVRRGRWENAYIIGGYPLEAERERLAEMLGADKFIFIDTSKELCLLKAGADDQMKNYITDWFDKYTPPID